MDCHGQLQPGQLSRPFDIISTDMLPVSRSTRWTQVFYEPLFYNGYDLCSVCLWKLLALFFYFFLGDAPQPEHGGEWQGKRRRLWTPPMELDIRQKIEGWMGLGASVLRPDL
jgi:hypothetical protein